MSLDDNFAEMQGWDAAITIPEPGEDPFAELDDETLLTMHPGMLAAVAAAQSNQMRVLDSSIVPDSALVYPSALPASRFNEFAVTTPMTTAERFVVINEDGVEEEVLPPEPFYPGLADREDATPTALATKLEEYAGDPYAVMLATGCAALQMGVEAGHSVTGVAHLFSAVWGRPGMYTADTVAALDGASSYAHIFGRDRMVDARSLSSWQAQSKVRSGMLAMTTDDWGPGLHCDFRRIRVAAEGFFAATVTMESGPVEKPGRVTYFVPSTSLLSADPSYLWPSAVDTAVCRVSPKIGPNVPVLKAVEALGLLPALWPTRDAVVAASWAATFGESTGIRAAKRAPRSGETRGGAVVGHATALAFRFVASVSRGVGRTHMTTLSAKVYQLALNCPTTQVLNWMARFVAVLDVLRLYGRRTTKKKKEYFRNALSAAWRQLKGDVARQLEVSTTDEDFEEINRLLPRDFARSDGSRSSRVLVQYMLLELVHTSAVWNHTLAKGFKRALLMRLEDAALTRVSAASYNPASPPAAWLNGRFGALRDFWAGRYGALASAAPVAHWLPTNTKWWVDVAAAVSCFRASYMRSIAIATDGRDRRGALDVGVGTGHVTIYCNPYHAAAAFRTSMNALLATELARFDTSEYIPHWLAGVGTRIAADLVDSVATLPKFAARKIGERHVPTLSRALQLVYHEDGLCEWAEDAFASAAADVTVLLTTAQAIAMGPVTRMTGAHERATAAATSAAMASALQAMAAAVEAATAGEGPSELFILAENLVADDPWDEFILAVELEEHADHERAAIMMRTLKEATTTATAESVAIWISRTFAEDVTDTTKETGGAVH